MERFNDNNGGMKSLKISSLSKRRMEIKIR
jgi:hypothetical protein